MSRRIVTLEDLRAEVRERGKVEVKPEDKEAFFEMMRAEIDAGYKALEDQLAASWYPPGPPEGWAPPKLTARQRLRIWSWRVRGWLAWPFVRVVGWLDPSALQSEDD